MRRLSLPILWLAGCLGLIAACSARPLPSLHGDQVPAYVPWVYHDSQGAGEWLTCSSSQAGALYPPLMRVAVTPPATLANVRAIGGGSAALPVGP